MNQKSGSGKLVGGIILCVVGAFNALLGFIFGLVGIVFLANPESADMTVNGETLHGEEAVEAANEEKLMAERAALHNADLDEIIERAREKRRIKKE